MSAEDLAVEGMGAVKGMGAVEGMGACREPRCGGDGCSSALERSGRVGNCMQHTGAQGEPAGN